MSWRRLQRSSLLVLIGLPALAAIAGCAADGTEALRVATLNIAHGRGLAPSQVTLRRVTFERNIGDIAATLRREAADVVALQEADAPSAWSGRFDHVQRLADAAGYPHRHHGRHFHSGVMRTRIAYGTALLSRLPLRSAHSQAFEARTVGSKGFVTAEVEFAGGRLLVGSVHLTTSAAARPRRLEQAAELICYLKRSILPVVLLGDFNCAWESDDALRRVADELGLVAYRPDADGRNTFPANQPVMRIDWILISPELEFIDYRVCPDQVSDHLMVTADLRWRSRE